MRKTKDTDVSLRRHVLNWEANYIREPTEYVNKDSTNVEVHILLWIGERW